jgi:hypothetical protein
MVSHGCNYRDTQANIAMGRHLGFHPLHRREHTGCSWGGGGAHGEIRRLARVSRENSPLEPLSL